MEVADGDTAAGEVHPRVNIGGVIVGVTDQLVTLAPRDAIGKDAKPQRGGAEEGDLVGVGADEIGGNDAGFVDAGDDGAELLVVLARLAGVIDHRIRDDARQDGNPGVGEENLLAADREGVAACGLVQDQGGDGVSHGVGEAADAGFANWVVTVNSW